MARPLIPPRYVNVPPFILFHPALPDGAKVFYGQVRALAWQSNYQSTPPLTMEELQAVTNKHKTAIYGYMTTLRISTALLWHTTGDGRFIFSFPVLSDSANTESPNHLLLNPLEVLEVNQEEEGSPQFRKSGKPEKIPETPAEAMKHPDLQTFKEICGRIPGARDYGLVIETIQFFRGKHGEKIVETLKPYWIAWSGRKRRSDGKPYDPASLTWLTEWAVNETIPSTNGAKHANRKTNDTANRESDPEQWARDEETARLIREQRAAKQSAPR